MGQPKLELKPADRVEITTILDNTVDMLLSSSDSVKRFRVQRWATNASWPSTVFLPS